jgi:hypothetical protein
MNAWTVVGCIGSRPSSVCQFDARIGARDWYARTLEPRLKGWRQSMESWGLSNAWRSSSKCESSNCVEVLIHAGGVAVRDGADVDGPVLRFHAAAWAVFVGRIDLFGEGQTPA